MQKVAVIGLGTMGSNLALNLNDHGYEVHVFNRSSNKTKYFAKRNQSIIAHYSIEELTIALGSQRVIILMVPAGDIVDNFLNRLNEYLDSEDIVIDGGNSFYKDTVRRHKTSKFKFAGCGISGGEVGARFGPSIMVGCDQSVYQKIGPILESISAKHDNKPCCSWMGNDGAGHFVKIVHNGIEYCEMQLLQEIINIKRNESIDDPELAIHNTKNLFEKWNEGYLNGYLIEICVKILSKKINDNFAINMIKDKAEQKGTGKMCILSSVESESEASAMAESVMARFLSKNLQKRVIFSDKIVKKHNSIGIITDEDLKSSFILCKAISFIQGFNLIMKFKKINKWCYEIHQICDVWRDGCILRCKFLDEIKEMSKNSEVLEISDKFLEIYNSNINALEKLCEYGVKNGLYIPVFISCLMWLNGLKMKKNNGDLLQAMRDYFGRHGVVLNTGETVNIEWDK